MPQTRPKNGTLHVASAQEARAIFDRAARRELGISGEEFLRKWEAGEFKDPDRPDVMRVAMLLPLARA